jgi:hypothetical protein
MGASPAAGARLGRAYATAAAIVGAVIAWSCWVVRGPSEAISARALVRPMLAQFWLTALVWVVMLVARNAAVLRGKASVRYFVAYQSDVPAEHIERPARAFDNLMQVPTLFYVVCLLMLVSERADAAQELLAWTFVALRALHALLFVALNRVPLRFASWVSSCIALGVLWYRFGVLQLVVDSAR